MTRAVAGALVACALVVLLPGHASAHALLVSSNPQTGQTLATGPGVVALEFSEAINPRLSSASVTDPTGHQWRGEVTGGQEIRIPVQTNAQGVYTVSYATVSYDDGHHVTGGFSFGVGVNPAKQAGGGGPQVTDVLIGVARWVEALALLALVGQLLVGQLARRRPRLDWVRPHLWFVPVALSAGLIVVWAEAFTASGGHSAANFLSFFTSGTAGVARLVRIGLEVLLFGAYVVRARTRWLWLGAAGALAGIAAAGHAATVQPAWWGIATDSVHLLAAGLWAGGITALATQRPPGGWRSAEGLGLLRRWSPVALAAFAVTVAGGGLEAAFQLGSLGALVGTAYGRVLVAKIVLVAAMLPLSLLAWRLRRPRPRVEGAVAACVIAAASSLSTAGLPHAGDLTLAGPAGQVLVGLSLEPGRPGPNHVVVSLTPIQGNSAAAGLIANATVGTTTKPLRTCGVSCRDATFTLVGGETLDIDVLNPSGGRATFTIPPLPAPDGGAALRTLQQRMHALQSYAIAETLSSGRTQISSSYASVAPDRSTFAVNGLTNVVWIGTTQYTREAANTPWRVSTGLPRNRVPAFVWDYFEPLADAHIVGHDTVDGVPTTVVGAFGNRSGTALWFRFWIDGDGRARQVYMDAPGHFMVDTYLSYNEPLRVDAPVR